MAKAILVCYKYASSTRREQQRLRAVCQRVSPDHVTLPSPLIVENKGVHLGILNPSQTLLLDKASLCLGNLLGTVMHWSTPKSKIPDGTYALFRSNEQYVEILTDIVASRSIWYVHTDDLFIASTSQRMLITYLGRFKPNKNVYAWMFSTGTLGPNLSWDKRIKLVPSDAVLRLNRKTWKLSLEIKPVRFSVSTQASAKHLFKLSRAVQETCTNLRINYAQWALPLSGGVDSRIIFSHLPHKKKLRTMTWGLASALEEKDSDAYVAQLVASHFSSKHRFYPLDLSKEGLEIVLDRFLKNGEGRIDHLAGYVDGFTMWKQVYEQGIQGIIRGDIGLSAGIFSTEQEVRFKLGLKLLTDFEELGKLLDNFELEVNSVPTYLKRFKKETLQSWHDRARHQYRLPVVLAALNDLKLSYVEIINPLLSRTIIHSLRTIPDELRSDKLILKQLIERKGPAIHYASYSATLDMQTFLQRTDVMKIFTKELTHSTILSDKLIAFILGNLTTQSSRYTTINFHRWAFRAFIISRMHTILKEDAQYCGQMPYRKSARD